LGHVLNGVSFWFVFMYENLNALKYPLLSRYKVLDVELPEALSLSLIHTHFSLCTVSCCVLKLLKPYRSRDTPTV
jgi:hypothetical protein